MYHIKNDKRAETSAKLIYDGLSELLDTIPFDRITVSDIQRVSTVGRSTFYRNFDTTADVLYWQCDKCFQEMVSAFINDEKAKQFRLGLLYVFFNYWTTHSKILEQIIAVNRIDIIFECHSKHATIISDYFRTKQIVPDENEYFIAIRSGIFVSILMVWLKRGKKESVNDLIKILSEQLVAIKNNKYTI